jgi:hypothetical protein
MFYAKEIKASNAPLSGIDSTLTDSESQMDTPQLQVDEWIDENAIFLS